MAGAGSTTEGKVNGIDIYGWTTPVTIEKMTNIPTHNLGGSGEDSSYITFRADGTKVYIDRDITISETDSAIARIIDEDGNVFKADDYSGYGFDYDPYPGDMYINGYLCDVDISFSKNSSTTSLSTTSALSSCVVSSSVVSCTVVSCTIIVCTVVSSTFFFF